MTLGEYRPVDPEHPARRWRSGILLALQGYYKLGGSLFAYMDAFYLFNPHGDERDPDLPGTLSPCPEQRVHRQA